MAAHPQRRPVHLDRTHRPTIHPRTRTNRHTPTTPARHTRTRRPTILRTRPESRLPERDTEVAAPRSHAHSTTATGTNRAPTQRLLGNCVVTDGVVMSITVGVSPQQKDHPTKIALCAQLRQRQG